MQLFLLLVQFIDSVWIRQFFNIDSPFFNLPWNSVFWYNSIQHASTIVLWDTMVLGFFFCFACLWNSIRSNLIVVKYIGLGMKNMKYYQYNQLLHNCRRSAWALKRQEPVIQGLSYSIIVFCLLLRLYFKLTSYFSLFFVWYAAII